jgi:hypothetical protein
MQNSLERYSESHREEALFELRLELAEFNHDGLIQLAEDLTRSAVARGSWGGCVISYKRGAPGSARRDRLGRARNAFTILWDNGWLTDEDVLAMTRHELSRRQSQTPRIVEVSPAPAVDPPIFGV